MNRIRALREEAGLSRRELAERCHIDVPMLYRWEKSLRMPTVGNALALARELGAALGRPVSVEDLDLEQNAA